MKKLPLTRIQAFAAIYRTGGVRAAAADLNVSHSAVSHHLRELEGWLELPLVRRRDGARKLVFSEEGRLLGEAASACLGELATVVDSIRETRLQDDVIVATTPSFAARWLMPRMGRLYRRHPGISLSLVVDQRRRALADEGADLAIRIGRRPAGNVSSQAMMDDELYPVMSPDYWRARGCPQALTGLTRLALIHDRDPAASWASWKKRWGPAKLNTRKGSRFTSSDLVLDAAEAGLGVALARGRLAADAVEGGGLIAPFEGCLLHVPEAYWLVEAPSSSPRGAVQQVRKWLLDEAANPRNTD